LNSKLDYEDLSIELAMRHIPSYTEGWRVANVKESTVSKFSEVLTESSIEGYEPLENPVASEILYILKIHQPLGYLWHTVWVDGQEVAADASTLLAMDLIATKRTEYFKRDLGDGSYIRGSVGYDHNGTVIWLRWGVGCPMDSGCDEILTVVTQQ
jgi:hypothetical protein